jgi:hypothetical protein
MSNSLAADRHYASLPIALMTSIQLGPQMVASSLSFAGNQGKGLQFFWFRHLVDRSAN